jgi:hypothetical protein
MSPTLMTSRLAVFSERIDAGAHLFKLSVLFLTITGISGPFRLTLPLELPLEAIGSR